MAEKGPSGEDQPFGSSSASYLGLSTETIDISGPLFQEVTESGSFDLRGFRLTAVGRLLNAVPTPALLIDGNSFIVFANDASRKLVDDVSLLQTARFSSLFPRPGDVARFQRILQEVFTTRKVRMGEGLVEVGANRLWSRMNFRSVRIGLSRFVIVLIEDLTLEKKQLLLIETHKEGLRQASERFERQLKEQTAELKLANERLREEIEQRTRTQEALEKSRESFSSIVEETSDGIAVVDCQGTVLYANQPLPYSWARSRESLSEIVSPSRRYPVPSRRWAFVPLQRNRVLEKCGSAELIGRGTRRISLRFEILRNVNEQNRRSCARRSWSLWSSSQAAWPTISITS